MVKRSKYFGKIIVNKDMSGIEKHKNKKHFISFTENHMNDDEKILDVIDGLFGTLMETKGDNKQESGLLFCTNQKVSFHRKGIFSDLSRSIPIKKISSIDVDKGILFHKIVFHTSGDKILFECSEGMDDVKNFVKQVEKMRDEIEESSENSQEPGNSKKSDDPIEKLKKLKELKDQGVINDKDFEEKKKKLLDSI